MSTCYVGRHCTSSLACMPFASACVSNKDCSSKSCCVVLNVEALEVNIPGRAFPPAQIDKCEDTGNFCYQGRCMRTFPNSWGQSQSSDI